MNEQKLFSAWIDKTKQAATQVNNSAVIYTKVSSKEQAMTNLSLQFQKQAVVEYAQKYDFNIVAEFGGLMSRQIQTGVESSSGCLSSSKRTRAKYQTSWSIAPIIYFLPAILFDINR